MKIHRTDLLAVLLIIATAGYGLWVYPQLPDPMPVHFGLNGEPDGFAPKSLFYVLLLPIMNLVVYFLTKFLISIDPKTRQKEGSISLHTDKILLAVVVLLSLVSFFVIHSMDEGRVTIQAGRLLSVGLAIFISILGNYMNNIRPNYFVGFRTPWTLESADVWRKTHRLGAKIWFWGGIISAVIAAFSPMTVGIVIVAGFILASSIFLTLYSYKIYPER